MSIEKNIQILVDKVGAEKTNKLLNILIEVETDSSYETIKIITSKVLNTFSISETELLKGNSHDTKRIKSLYVYFLSKYTSARNKDIALFTKTSVRNVYRYKKNAKELISAEKASYTYKFNTEFIEKAQNLNNAISNKTNKISHG